MSLVFPLPAVSGFERRTAAYASCDASHKIAAIRTSDWTVEKLIDAGPGAEDSLGPPEGGSLPVKYATTSSVLHRTTGTPESVVCWKR